MCNSGVEGLRGSASSALGTLMRQQRRNGVTACLSVLGNVNFIIIRCKPATENSSSHKLDSFDDTGKRLQAAQCLNSQYPMSTWPR